MEFTITWTEHRHAREDANAAPLPDAVRWASQKFDYALKDSKGRAIGGSITIERLGEVFRNEIRDADGRYVGTCWAPTNKEPYYRVTHNALRNGKVFGAIPRGTKCASLEEARTLAAKKLKEAQRRFARAVAKGEGKQYARKDAL